MKSSLVATRVFFLPFISLLFFGIFIWKLPALAVAQSAFPDDVSGCFQVKSAPQFSRSGYHDLDAQKRQALAVKKPCQRSASLLLCDRKL